MSLCGGVCKWPVFFALVIMKPKVFVQKWAISVYLNVTSAHLILCGNVLNLKTHMHEISRYIYIRYILMLCPCRSQKLQLI